MKLSKKINKMVKVMLILGLIFVQLANPVKVLASELTPSYNLSMELDSETDEFLVISDGTLELVSEDKYIVETVRSFEYFDGQLNEEENTISYKVVLGSELTTGISLEHQNFSYNGVSYIDVNVYELTDETIDLSTYTEEEIKALLLTDKVNNIMNTSFEEGISYNKTELTLVATGDNVICEENTCTVSEVEGDNVVTVSYDVKTGNFNPNKKYYIALYVNDVMMDSEIGDYVLNFANLLSGTYDMRYEIRDEENNSVITNNVILDYTTLEEKDIVEYYTNNTDMIGSLFSYTTLTEEEKELLGNDYRHLEKPVALAFDLYVADKSEILASNYNEFDGEDKYHVMTSEKFVGVFSEEAESFKVKDLKDELSKLEIPYSKYVVVNANNEEVKDDEFIQNGMKLVVTICGEEFEYDLLIYGDVDSGLVEVSDINGLIEKILNDNVTYYDKYNLDLNTDEVIDVKDVSLLGVSVFEGKFIVPELEPVDTIIPVIEMEEEVIRVGDSFEVVLSFTGFELDYFNAIEGYVNYNKETLRLDNIELLDELFVGTSLENRFMYASDAAFSSNEEKFVKFTFTAIGEGEDKISVVPLNLVADGVSLSANNSNELDVTVLRALHTDATIKTLTSSYGYFNKAFDPNTFEYTLYVDSYVNSITLSGELNDIYATTEDFRTYVLAGDNTTISLNVTAENGDVNTYRINVIKVYKSSNNNLSNIIIDGYEIEFNKNTLEYTIEVESDVDSLDISALVEHYGAWAKIEGNENFKEGNNVVTITVYAENGTTKTYKLNVNKKAKVVADVTDKDDKDEEESVKSEKIVIIILIVLVVIGLLYLIFKKDEDEEEPRIEQIKPKKEEPKKVEVKKEENRKEEIKKNNNHHNNKNKKKK